jgi:hypothetical protein
MNQAKSEIRQLAQKIIDNQIDLVEGCRKIDQLSYFLDDSGLYNGNKDLLFIKGICSESDRFPLGKVRETCSPKHLAELDLDKRKFIAFYKDAVLDSCQNIIRFYR